MFRLKVRNLKIYQSWMLSKILQAVVSQQLMLSVRPLLLECAHQNRVTDYQLRALIANDLSDQSPNIQCLSLCFFQKLGLMDGNANVDVDRTIMSFSLGENPLNVNDNLIIIDFC